MGLTPAGVGIAFAVWLVLFLTTRYVSVASIGAAPRWRSQSGGCWRCTRDTALGSRGS